MSHTRRVSIFIFLPLIAATILTLGCKTRATTSGKGTMNAKSAQESGGVKFGLFKRDSAKLNGPATGDESLSDVVVTIKDEGGNTVSEDRKIPLLKLSDTYITSTIHLPPGTYTLESFAVLEGENVIYASPLTGSPRAHLVVHPLPISMTIPKDDVAMVIPEVVDVYEATPADFGFASFKFQIVKALAFSIAVSVFNETTGQMELTSAHVAITGMTQASYYDGELLAQTNQVTINDIDDTITITVSKDGYSTESKSLTTEELKAADLQSIFLNAEPTP